MELALTPMTLDQFRSTFQAGGFSSVSVIASGGVFVVTGAPRTGQRVVLTTTRGRETRSFRDPGKAVAILHDIGARKVEIDTSDWSPGLEPSNARRRPDTAERQRRTHAAAAHDAWFRAEVEQALLEAAEPDAEWISNDEVVAESAARRAEWRAKAGRSE